MQEEEIHLLDYWRTLVKRRNIAIAFFIAVVSIAGVYSFAAKPVYQGTSQILVDLQNNPATTFVEGGSALVQMKDPAEYYNTQIEIVKSRAFADRIVRKMQLDKNAYYLEKKEDIRNNLFSLKTIKEAVKSLFPSKMVPINPFPESSVVQELDPDLTDIVLKEMDVEVGKMSNILKIHYNSDNPVVAAAMANGSASAYIENNLDIRVKPFRDAVEWLSAKMIELRTKVEESEKGLQKYKESTGVVSFESKENVITQKLAEIMSQLVQAEGKRQEAEIRFKQIKSVVNKPELLATVPDIMNNLVIQGLRNQELEIKRQVSELSEKYGPKHPQMIKAKIELQSTQKSLIDEARKMLNAAKTDYEIALGRETSLKRAIDEQKQEVLDLSRQAIEFNVVSGESESNKQFYELLLKKIQEASLSSGINVSNAQVVDSATVPKYPVKPRKGLNLLLAMIFGTFGGIFAAFFVEYMDDTIKGPEDVDRMLGLPFLGFVPFVKDKGHLHILSDPRSSIAESYRTIRTGIMLSTADKAPQVILVASATPNEGKTTTAANLAITMAQMDEKVLLIDGDMRRHNMHEVFKMDNTSGISDLIVGNSNSSTAIKPFPQLPNLDIIGGGTLAPNPSELLFSNRTKDLLRGLRESYDRIIIDSPPIMTFSDPLILSSLVDGVILVVWGGVTSRHIINRASQSLVGVKAKMLGVVLNKTVISEKNPYNYPYYGYNYSEGNGSGKKKG